jgi:hypothetical protein
LRTKRSRKSMLRTSTMKTTQTMECDMSKRGTPEIRM